MYLYTTCKSCAAVNKVKSNAMTRPDLERDIGESFMMNCMSCGAMKSTHVNDVKANMSLLPILIGILVGLVLTILLFAFGWIAMATIVIPFYLWNQQQTDVKGFNNYRI